MPSQDVNALSLMKEDLSRSLLQKPTVMKTLAFRALSATESVAVSDSKKCRRLSYIIPYFDFDGNPQDFFRLRFLDDEDPRYWQQPDTLPRLYLPPLNKQKSWSEIAADPSIPIMITEGEKKAACATMLGVPTVGLGGVWCWRSSKKGMSMIPDLQKFEWLGRRVELIFDSDIVKKVEVQQALEAFSMELTRFGADVYQRHLPITHKGLDDYFLEYEVSDLEELPCELTPYAEALQQMNDDIAMINRQGRVLLIENGGTYPNLSNMKAAFANRLYQTIDGRSVSLCDEWMKWAGRRTHRDITYEPAEPRVTDSNDYNTWEGWGVEPKSGDCKIWVDFIRDVIDDDEVFDWFLKWLAYPLQNPGTKLFQGVVIWSREHGTGKSFIGQVMLDIYGTNGIEITQQDLHSGYNDWLAEKQFVLGEEVSAADRRKDADILKNIMTGERVRVNKKYVPNYVVPNMANLLFNSNHPDAAMLDTEDRRYTVIEITHKKPLSLFKRLDKWRSNGGSAHFFNYLLEEVDVSDFDPKAPAIDTRAKQSMISLNLSGLDRFAQDLLNSPDSVFAEYKNEMKRELFTTSEIAAFLPGDLRDTHVTALSKALIRQGAHSYGRPIMIKGRGSVRLIAIRKIKHWRSASTEQWRSHYVQHTAS